MQSSYPFDPHDWATITPLYVALSEAPVSPDGFMEWLARWNELDIAVYDAWTHLKRRAYYDTSDLAAERAYQLFTQEVFSTHLGLTNTLAARALAIQAEPPLPAYQQLWRRWRNQTALFHPASLPIQAEISRLESGYRELTRRIERLPGNWRAHWMDRRAEMNELMLRLLKLRRQLARTSGLPTFLAYRWRELNRLDYSIEECQAFHRAVEKAVVPAITQLRSRDTPGRPGLEVTNPDLLGAGVERILQNVDPAVGALFRAMRDGYLDLGSRPGKAVTSEQWFFPRAGMPYLHVASTNPATLLHESGHAFHDYLSFQSQRSLWNASTSGPEEFQEFAAIGLELLCWPYYEQSHGGLYSAAESLAARQDVLRFYLESMVGNVMEDAYEHWVYGEAPEDVTPADLDAKWLDLKQRFTPWDDGYASEDEKMTGWQRGNWSLFRIPLYTIAYSIAIVATCHLGLLAETDRPSVIDNYKAALSLGNTRPLPELFRVAGILFPFTHQAVEAAVEFVLDRLSFEAETTSF